LPAAAEFDETDLRVPPPLPEPPRPLLAVGKHGPASVEAEDFARRLGNWGNASKLIGERWEAIAPGLLSPRLPWLIPLGAGQAAEVRALLSLDADPLIGATLQRAGISAPDLLFIGVSGARAYVRAADCKVSLDTADREQTAPTRLQKMFARAAQDFPIVATALLAQVEALPPTQRDAAGSVVAAALAADWRNLLIADGLFVAPDNGFNRWFLSRLDDRRRTGAALGRMPGSGPRRTGGDVIGPVDAAQAARLTLPSHLEAIGALDFLGGVPGWEEAQLVARLDGVDLQHDDLAVAERCWRVGVGLRGAVFALKRPLFRNPMPVDKPEVESLDVLQQVLRRCRVHDSAGLVAAFDQLVAARRELWYRESAALRTPVSFGTFSTKVGDTQRTRHRPRAGEPPRQKVREQVGPSTRALYRELSRFHVMRVARLARDLETGGLLDGPLLDALEARAETLSTESRQDAAQIAARMEKISS